MRLYRNVMRMPGKESGFFVYGCMQEMPYEAMANVQAVGKETQLLAGFGIFGANVPVIKIKNFKFTGVTA